MSKDGNTESSTTHEILKDDASLLVILLETGPELWNAKLGARSASSLSLSKFCEQVVVFVNAYLMLHRRNRLACIGMHSGKCKVLYETPGFFQADAKQAFDPTLSEPIGAKLMRSIKLFAEEEHNGLPSEPVPVPLSAALSMALCLIQRARRGSSLQNLAPRILCLHGSPDPPAQYIAIMNTFFSAARNDVLVDSCLLGMQDSAFLQQAAHITGGCYLRPPRLDGLLQYLLSVFAVDRFSRQFMELPQSSGVDFRASCFCHKNTIDIGFVCSVCLSIFCQSCVECSTCGTAFSVAKPAGKKRKAVVAE